MIRCPGYAALIQIGLCVSITRAATPQAVVTVSVGRFLAKDAKVDDVSPVFLSNELVALLISSGTSRIGVSKILVMRWTGAKLEPVSNTSKAHEGDQIFAVSGDRVLVSAVYHKYLYSADLKQRWEISIPTRVLPDSFPRSGTVGEWTTSGWRTFRIGPPITLRREGSGKLLSVSDDVIVYLLDNAIRAEKADGGFLGSIPAPPGTNDSHAAETAGRGRLYLDFYGEERIVDFKGRELLRLRRPEGWGFRHGWSADGGRLLFDHFTRTIPFSRKLADIVFRALGGPEESNGETITVIDARNGGNCFTLEIPEKLFGRPGHYHADLSPSGQWVAASTLTDLSIYRLPEVCAEKSRR